MGKDKRHSKKHASADENGKRHLTLHDLPPLKVPGAKQYQEALKQYQIDILQLQRQVMLRKQRIMLLFEGMDAAGKGGVIKRLTMYLDPRGFEVHTTGPPSPDERGHHYLRRFW